MLLKRHFMEDLCIQTDFDFLPEKKNSNKCYKSAPLEPSIKVGDRLD